MQLNIPHGRGDLIAAAHREGDVIDSHENDEMTVLHVVLDDAGKAKFSEFAVAP